MSDEKTTNAKLSARYDSGQHADKDEFHRRPFAARVADIIVNRPLGEPLVVAMVGEWGSGKSTTLGYVKDCLSGKPCAPAEFNPWRFKGEEALLLELFSELVKAIDPNFKVLTQWQGIAKWLDDNQVPLTQATTAAGNSLLPGAGSMTASAFGFFKNKLHTKIEQVRQQAKEHLERSQRRIVVLLDDIDRLEADDMLTLMRLIKLTGDLPNVTYVLAMDEDHVSRVIGQRLDGNQETGRSYLDKIINVRLSLPRIPDYKMKSYTLDLINEVLTHTSCDVRDEELQRTLDIFDKLCAPLIMTPRKAKSIANAYRFALGLLPRDEVNAGDLLIMESLRLLRPTLHEALFRVMPGVFQGLRSSNLQYFQKSNQASAEEALHKIRKELLDTAGPLTEFESARLWNALGKLFPQLFGFRAESMEKKWAESKLVCSPQYFWRYYSGAIQDDDVSDHVVYQWLASLKEDKTFSQRQSLLIHLDSKYSDAFMYKLEIRVSTLDNESLKRLAFILADSSKELPRKSYNEMRNSIWHEAAALSAECLSTLASEDEAVLAACEVVTRATDLVWCIPFINRLPKYCRSRRSEGEGSEIRRSQVDVKLAKRILENWAVSPPECPETTKDQAWILWFNRHEIQPCKQVTQTIQKHPHLAFHLLTMPCTYSIPSSTSLPRWSGMRMEQVQNLGEIVDLDVLRDVLRSKLPQPAPVNIEGDVYDHGRHQFDSLDHLAWLFLNQPLPDLTSEANESE